MSNLEDIKFKSRKSEVRMIAGVKMCNKHAIAEIFNVTVRTAVKYIEQMPYRKIGNSTWVAEEYLVDWVKGHEFEDNE